MFSTFDIDTAILFSRVISFQNFQLSLCNAYSDEQLKIHVHVYVHVRVHVHVYLSIYVYTMYFVCRCT